MIKAVIFDMDGLLIDSEPLWHEAEIDTFKLVNISLTEKECMETTGLRLNELVDYWHRKYPWDNFSKEEVGKRLTEKLLGLVKEKGAAKKGAEHILEFMKSKKIKIALASSSLKIKIETVVDKLGIRSYFDELYSAEFEEYGKPHPGVYITTAKTLDVPASECLAFEDSFNGLLAAKAAKMKCVCVPDESIAGSPKLAIADVVLPTLSDFNEKIWQMLDE